MSSPNSDRCRRSASTEVEGLFAADLAFLQDLYGIINFGDHADVEALQASVLPDEPEPDVVDDIDVIDVEVVDAEPVAEAQPTPTSRRRSRIEEVSPAVSQ